MTELLRFIQKHEFPFHLTIVWREATAALSKLSSTLWVKFFLKATGCRYGKNVLADGLPVIRISKRGKLTFGDNCQLNSRLKSNLVGKTNPTILDCRGDGSICFGNNSGCSFAVISSRAQIEIGDYVKIGGNVRIFDHDYHSLDYLDRRNGEKDQANCRKKPVKIGNDVFIGTNAIILKGVTIGDHAVIGAGSVVSCDVPADEIWAGNPARFVKKLEPSRG